MIQTVKGKIDKLENGTALIHEHISCVSNNFFNAFGKVWLDRQYLVDYATSILKIAKEKYNLNLFVDGTIMEIGRNASLLKEISEKSGVHIVASTGFYLFHDFGFDGISYIELADLLLKECETGLDGTDVKPGILKCAGMGNEITDEIIKKHACIGVVQNETGLPVYIHCEHKGNEVFEQIDVLEKNGANVEKLIIGHCAKRPEYDYLEAILKKGCCISMDQCMYFPDRLSDMSDCISKAFQEGYAEQILVSNDYCIHSDFASRNRNGILKDKGEQVEKLCYIFNEFRGSLMLKGLKNQDWEQIISKNVADILDVG